jgi:hypothetical protein
MVADEVRKLAERSAAATKDIGAFIQTIEGTASDATRAVDGVRGLADSIVSAASETAHAAGLLATSARGLSKSLTRFRVPGQVEAELLGLLRERRGDLGRALSGLTPLLESPEVARSPLGEALRRLMAVLAGGDGSAPEAARPPI